MSMVVRIDTTDNTNRVAEAVRVRMDTTQSADVVDGYLVIKLNDYYKPAIEFVEPPQRGRLARLFGR